MPPLMDEVVEMELGSGELTAQQKTRIDRRAREMCKRNPSWFGPGEEMRSEEDGGEICDKCNSDDSVNMMLCDTSLGGCGCLYKRPSRQFNDAGERWKCAKCSAKPPPLDAGLPDGARIVKILGDGRCMVRAVASGVLHDRGMLHQDTTELLKEMTRLTGLVDGTFINVEFQVGDAIHLWHTREQGDEDSEGFLRGHYDLLIRPHNAV
ncbi:hypothetical protein T484DRAFT_1838805 [Baffinella frigidus]|nr:hypothetical protein T484DRAFT_1838805 [Cryptophyta sp. CCMP2293]